MDSKTMYIPVPCQTPWENRKPSDARRTNETLCHCLYGAPETDWGS